jgi:hypothetical protein
MEIGHIKRITAAITGALAAAMLRLGSGYRELGKTAWTTTVMGTARTTTAQSQTKCSSSNTVVADIIPISDHKKTKMCVRYCARTEYTAAAR